MVVAHSKKHRFIRIETIDRKAKDLIFLNKNVLRRKLRQCDKVFNKF